MKATHFLLEGRERLDLMAAPQLAIKPLIICSLGARKGLCLPRRLWRMSEAPASVNLRVKGRRKELKTVTAGLAPPRPLAPVPFPTSRGLVASPHQRP
jgi:hypothetical protein